MTVYLEFGWNSHDDDLKDYLMKNELTIIHKGNVVNVDDENFSSLRDGMALRHKSGVVMRVMGGRRPNYENLSHDYVLASKSIKQEHLDLFRQ